MKKVYEIPEIKIMNLYAEDILNTSPIKPGNDDDDAGDWLP